MTDAKSGTRVSKTCIYKSYHLQPYLTERSLFKVPDVHPSNAKMGYHAKRLAQCIVPSTQTYIYDLWLSTAIRHILQYFPSVFVLTLLWLHAQCAPIGSHFIL